jgi:hypothetical protein
MSTSFQVNDSRGCRITIRGEALDEMLRGPDGYYVRDLMRRMEILQAAAKRQIRLGHIHAGGGPGNLRDSIVKRMQSPKGTNGVPVGVVGSHHPIALIHHEGTRPHVILPRRASALRWPGDGPDGFLFAKIVHHPGTRPNRYLTDNLHLISR